MPRPRTEADLEVVCIAVGDHDGRARLAQVAQIERIVERPVPGEEAYLTRARSPQQLRRRFELDDRDERGKIAEVVHDPRADPARTETTMCPLSRIGRSPCTAFH